MKNFSYALSCSEDERPNLISKRPTECPLDAQRADPLRLERINYSQSTAVSSVLSSARFRADDDFFRRFGNILHGVHGVRVNIAKADSSRSCGHEFDWSKIVEEVSQFQRNKEIRLHPISLRLLSAPEVERVVLQRFSDQSCTSGPTAVLFMGAVAAVVAANCLRLIPEPSRMSLKHIEVTSGALVSIVFLSIVLFAIGMRSNVFQRHRATIAGATAITVLCFVAVQQRDPMPQSYSYISEGSFDALPLVHWMTAASGKFLKSLTSQNCCCILSCSFEFSFIFCRCHSSWGSIDLCMWFLDLF